MNIACELDTTPQMINFVAIGIGCTIAGLRTQHRSRWRGLQDVATRSDQDPGDRQKDSMGIADHFFKFVLDELRIKRRVVE
jgi:hypothetical protein